MIPNQTTGDTIMNTTAIKAAATDKPVKKFFKSIDSMRRYINYRYGFENGQQIFDWPRHSFRTDWGRTVECGHWFWFTTKTGKVVFEQTKADADFPLREIKQKPTEDYDDMAGVRRMETMAAYIHSGAGLDNYYRDCDAGYID
jgi:hypothetical protein